MLETESNADFAVRCCTLPAGEQCLGKPPKQKLRQDFDLTARKEQFKIPIDRCIALLPVVHFSIRLQWLA